MRTEQLQIYKFDELSDEAKENARNWYRSSDVYHWGDDNMASLREFCKHFGLTLRDWSIGGSWCRDNKVEVLIGDDSLIDMNYVRLWKYLQANFVNDELLAGNCPWTGYVADEWCLDEIRSFIKKPDFRSFPELMQDCADRWLAIYVSEIDASYKDEAVDENIIANEYEFTGHGKFHS